MGDARVPRILHSVARNMQAKADLELEIAQRNYRIACKVIDDTEAAAVRAEAAILAAVVGVVAVQAEESE